MKKENFDANSNTVKYIFLFGLVAVFLGIGVWLTPSAVSLWEGIKRIVLHPSLMDFDSFYWAQDYGASFFQAGLCLLIVVIIFKVTDSDLQGPQIANALMVTGFAFYGKNILTMWFPIIGVYIYAKINKKRLSVFVGLALGLTCLGPIFGTLAFYTKALGEGSLLAFITASAVTIFVGFIASYFAEFFPRLHDGLLLYNAGMAAGWTAIIINSVLKATGLGHNAYPYDLLAEYITGENKLFGLILTGIFLYLIVFGLLIGGAKNTLGLFTYNGHKGNYIEIFGFGACLINMGLIGIISVIYIVLIKGDINGTIFACIFATVGFTCNGSTPRTQWPIFLGVTFGAFLTGGISALVLEEGTFLAGALAKIASRGMILSAFFSCGVSPITSYFGKRAGFLVGAVHSVVVPHLSVLHGWMSLYNNAISYGLITKFMRPIYSLFRHKSNFGKVR